MNTASTHFQTLKFTSHISLLILCPATPESELREEECVRCLFPYLSFIWQAGPFTAKAVLRISHWNKKHNALPKSKISSEFL